MEFKIDLGDWYQEDGSLKDYVVNEIASHIKSNLGEASYKLKRETEDIIGKSGEVVYQVHQLTGLR